MLSAVLSTRRSWSSEWNACKQWLQSVFNETIELWPYGSVGSDTEKGTKTISQDKWQLLKHVKHSYNSLMCLSNNSIHFVISQSVSFYSYSVFYFPASLYTWNRVAECPILWISLCQMLSILVFPETSSLVLGHNSVIWRQLHFVGLALELCRSVSEQCVNSVTFFSYP